MARIQGNAVQGHIKGFNAGKTSGLGVAAFWTKLFKKNFKEKLTDTKLAAAFAAEFPKREKVTAVARHRSWYNRGAQGYGTGKALKDEARSIAYDNKGKETAGDWGPKTKPNKKLSEIARKRAVKMWAKRKKAGGGSVKKAAAASKPAKKLDKKAKLKAKVKKAAAPAKAAKPDKAPAGKAKKTFKVKGQAA